MAGKICAVSGCPNTSGNTKGKGINFHNFPKNREIRDLWFKALNKSVDWDPRKKLGVCSSHFTLDDYGSSEKVRVLKRSAVPSVWGPVLSSKTLNVTENEISNYGNIPALSKETTLGTYTITTPEKDNIMNPISSNYEVIFQEEPLLKPIGSSYTSSTSTQPLGIEISSSIRDCQERVEIESEDEIIEGFLHETKPHLEDKYLVFISQLLLLFKFCRRPDCQKNIVHLVRKVSGTCLKIKTKCLDGHEDTWESQPMFGLTSWGNYLLAASMYFSGEIPLKFLRVFKNLSIRVFSSRMYFAYQRMFHPLIEKLWMKEQETLFSDVSKKFTVCGDARVDSSGFFPKYGTYTFMDAEANKILHIELVQSTKVVSSNTMELEGLKRGLEFFSNMMVLIAKIVTDCNQGVIAYLRDKHSSIIHEFDNWHVAKNIKSKLEGIGKKQKYEAINLWIPAIINHIYWIGATSTSNEEERKQMWLSLLNHVSNVHEGHGSKFPKCLHAPIENNEQRIWLSRRSRLFAEVSKIINSSSTQSMIYKLSKCQTDSLEIFHSVLDSFCPKIYHFTKDSMKSRISLAALHYNENGNKVQAVISKEEQYNGNDPKVLVESTYEYVGKLMTLAYEEVFLHPLASDLITSPFNATNLSSFYSKEVC